MKSAFPRSPFALLCLLLLETALTASGAAAANTIPSPYLFSYAVSTNTPVPDRPGTKFAITNGPPAPALDGNYLAFMETNGVTVLWSLNTATGVFTRLADTTTPVPGGTSTFDSFNSFELFNGVVVFSAAGSSDPRGLFSVPATGGAITKLIDLNTPVPGGTGTLSFDSNDGPYYRINDGGVLFGANIGVYLVPAAGGAITRISDGSTAPGGNLPSSGDESTGLAALVAFNGDVYGDAFLYSAPTTGVTSSPPNYTLLAGEGTPVPGSTDGSTFGAQIAAAVRSSAGTVVFTGEYGNNVRGIYSAVGGVLSTLVDTNTAVPLGPGTFTQPNNTTILPDTNALSFRDGEIAFEGLDSDRNNGIYTEPATGGAITLVYDEANPDPVDGSGAGGITYGSYALSAGRVAFLFTQEFSQNAIIIATPKPNITPTMGGDTGVVTLTISGKNFAPGASVALSATGEPTLTAELVTPSANGTALAALFDLTGKADGLYDLTITNADGSVLSYPASFTIEPGTGPQVYADVIGRSEIRGGYFQTYTVICGNSGNTDAFDVPLLVTVPSYIDLEPGNFSFQTLDPPAGYTEGAFATRSLLDPAYSVGNVVLADVPAGQYLALTFLVKAPTGSQYADKQFIISAVPLQPLLKPDPKGTVKPPGGLGPILEPVLPPVQMSPSVFPPLPPLPYPGVPPLFINFPNGILPIIHAPFSNYEEPIFPYDFPFPSPDDALLPTGGYQAPKIILPGDPNDKTGSLGIGAAHYLSAGEPLRYSVQFENEPTASAAARNVSIADQLDPTKVDLSTFALGPISFGSTVVSPPPGQNQYTATVDLRPANDLLVQIIAGLNVSTGLLTYTFTSLDPATGQPPADPTAGFLPPDVIPPAGEGFVFYTVSPLATLPTGTVITNQASVIFDVNAPILTPIWSNTLDTAIPSSKLAKLPATTFSSKITLHLSGTDNGGSGIAAYNVYVSDDNGPFTLAIANVAGPTATFIGTTGHQYRFFSQAESAVLNLQPLKNSAEATTRVVGPDLIGAFKGAVTGKRDGGDVEVNASFTVTNQSPSKPTTEGSVVRFYLSKIGVLSGAKVLGEVPFGALGPKVSQTVELTGDKVAETAILKGQYVIAVIDPSGVVKETDKLNNTVLYGPLK